MNANPGDTAGIDIWDYCVPDQELLNCIEELHSFQQETTRSSLISSSSSSSSPPSSSSSSSSSSFSQAILLQKSSPANELLDSLQESELYCRYLLFVQYIPSHPTSRPQISLICFRNFIAELDTILLHVAEMAGAYSEISDRTSVLMSSCEDLLGEQVPLYS